ncbi:unnamed protein product [Arabis nemorensis]|uniref:Uncharacterized protein n=1 Tax=Arabis nemorensis TaxID=586526 RepID=A0A565CRM4_9BRAS|nr:unnamed protein product [Arabis nemorensis]
MTQDLAERKARELCIHKQVNDLELDPAGWKKYLLLETETKGPMGVDKGKSLASSKTAHDQSKEMLWNKHMMERGGSNKFMGASFKAALSNGNLLPEGVDPKGLVMINPKVKSTTDGPEVLLNPQNQRSLALDLNREGLKEDGDVALIPKEPTIGDPLQHIGQKEGFGSYVPTLNHLKFKAGVDFASGSITSGKSRNSRQTTTRGRKLQSNARKTSDMLPKALAEGETEKGRVVKSKIVDDAEEVPSYGNNMSWAGTCEIVKPDGTKESVWIQCRLDRAFGNSEWFRLFLRTQFEYLERHDSDHRPIITRIQTKVAVTTVNSGLTKDGAVNQRLLK